MLFTEVLVCKTKREISTHGLAGEALPFGSGVAGEPLQTHICLLHCEIGHEGLTMAVRAHGSYNKDGPGWGEKFDKRALRNARRRLSLRGYRAVK